MPYLAILCLAKQTYEKVGKFNEALAYDFNDVEFCLRASAVEEPVIYGPQLTHEEQKTRKRFLMLHGSVTNVIS